MPDPDSPSFIKTTTFVELSADQVTDQLLVAAAELFSKHYGVWGEIPNGFKGLRGKLDAMLNGQGDRVTLDARRLRSHYLPSGSRSSYVYVVVDEVLAGQAFACRWDYDGQQVCWITQLVVHQDYRQRRLATRLLETLRKPEDNIFGIMSSQPAACMALCKACASFGIPALEFAREHAAAVLTLSPVAYIRNATLRGSLFSDSPSISPEDLVSGADSQFFVSHDEPNCVRERLQKYGQWSLGSLPDGHEYLVLFEAPPLPSAAS